MKHLNYLAPILLLFFFASCDKTHDEDPVPTPDPSISWADSVQRDLWAYFPFDSSNLSDQSGHHRNMRAANGILLGSDQGGSSNRALAFDGIDDYAVIDSGIHFPAGNFAISFFINAQNTTLGRVFNKADYNTALGASLTLGFEPGFQNNLTFGVTKSPAVCNSFSDLSNTNAIPSFRPFVANQWFHVVVQFENGVQSLYVNGRLVSAMYTPNATFPVCSTAPFYFGIWWLNDLRPFQGRLDNIRIYTRVLSENEIRYLYLNNQ